MKKLLSKTPPRLLLLLLVLFIATTITAATFTVNGIKYETISSSNNVRVRSYNSNLSGDIKIPAKVNGYTVTEIFGSAFTGSKITSIALPNSIKEIGAGAFSSCQNLKSINIPCSSVASTAFRQCPNLTYIFVEILDPYQTSYLYNLQSPCTIFTGDPSSLSYEIRNKHSVHSFSKPCLIAPKVTFTNFSFELYVPDLCEIKNISVDNGTITKINDDEYFLHDNKYTVSGKYNIAGLTPSNIGEYGASPSTTVTIDYSISDGDATNISFDIYTLSPRTGLDFITNKSTHSTVTFTMTEDCEDENVSECGIIGYYNTYIPLRKGESKVFAGLRPESPFYYKKYVKVGEEYYTSSSALSVTRPKFEVSAEVTALSAVSIRINGIFDKGDAMVTDCVAIVNGVETPLNPDNPTAEVTVPYVMNQPHTVIVKVSGNQWEFSSPEIQATTEILTWKNGQAVATSSRSARLMYEVNLPTGTPGTGIEWRRIDAPDLVSSTKVPCDVVNGTLVGTLKNLKDDVYYKFRPYYTALDGKSYYGDWIGLFTGDADVFFEPEVLTYAPTSSEQSVTLSGYALEGSDEIISQGFEYRPSTPVVRATSGWSVVKANGILMKATLTDLIPNASYICRSFVTTGSGTYYGEEQQFTAPALTGIDAVEEDMNDELSVTLRENPVNGDAYIRISGSDNKAVCSVYSLSGTLLIQKEVAADGLWQPVEMDRCVKGMYLMHVVCGNERKSLRIIKR